MKSICYSCVFIGKINEIHILINEKSNRKILGFLKISQDTFRAKIEPRSQELNPIITTHILLVYCVAMIRTVLLSEME